MTHLQRLILCKYVLATDVALHAMKMENQGISPVVTNPIKRFLRSQGLRAGASLKGLLNRCWPKSRHQAP